MQVVTGLLKGGNQKKNVANKGRTLEDAAEFGEDAEIVDTKEHAGNLDKVIIARKEDQDAVNPRHIPKKGGNKPQGNKPQGNKFQGNNNNKNANPNAKKFKKN